MNISKLICGFAALTLLTDVALAKPLAHSTNNNPPTNQGGYLPQGKPCGGAGCPSPPPPKLPPAPPPPWVPPKIQ
jgi:hypothetical protein